MLVQPLQQLSTVVVEIAQRELPARFNCRRGEPKEDGSLLTEADLVMQRELDNALRACWPAYAVLGEEMDESEQHAALQHSDTGLWCVDPLDGTSNFTAGIPYYGVSVALIQNGLPQMAVVYDPSRKECFAARRGQGAWLNGNRLEGRVPQTALRESIALIDLKRLPEALARRAACAPPFRSQRNFGAVALDWCWIAAGRGHLYLHGRQKLWDYAAGSLILEEAGGYAVTLDGEAVFAPTLKPRSTAAALNRELFEQWTAWLEIGDAGGWPPTG